jgi:hypothetical protein
MKLREIQQASHEVAGAFDLAFRVSKACRRIEIVFALVCDKDATSKVIQSGSFGTMKNRAS